MLHCSAAHPGDVFRAVSQPHPALRATLPSCRDLNSRQSAHWEDSIFLAANCEKSHRITSLLALSITSRQTKKTLALRTPRNGGNSVRQGASTTVTTRSSLARASGPKRTCNAGRAVAPNSILTSPPKLPQSCEGPLPRSSQEASSRGGPCRRLGKNHWSVFTLALAQAFA